MSSIDRTLHIQTPAIMTVADSTVMYFESALKVQIKAETFQPASSGFGKLPLRNKNLTIKITGTPSGVYAYKSVLMPGTHLNPTAGAAVFPATDQEVEIQEMRSSGAQKYTFKNCRMTKVPKLVFHAQKQLWGPVEFTALFANGTDPTDLDNWYVIAANAFSDTSFAPGDVLTQVYSALWNSLQLEQNVDGVEIDVDVGMDEEVIPNFGTANYRFSGDINAKAIVRPKILTAAEVAAALDSDGSGFVIGAGRQATGHDLVLSGTGVTVTMPSAHLDAGGFEFDSKAALIDQLEFANSRIFTAGAPGAILTLA
jgi:hypothetical protein